MEPTRDDEIFYEELSRLNSELVNLQREMAKKNAELGQNEKKLRVERDFAETLLDTAQAIIMVLDAQGRIVRLNRFMEVLSGYVQEEIENSNWLDMLIVTEDHAGARTLLSDTLKGHRLPGRTLRVLTKYSRQVEVEWHTSTLHNADGNPAGFLAVGHDITDHLKNEELLRNRQILESLGHIAGGFAHNFNNLMAGIFGYIEIAQDAAKNEMVVQNLTKAGNIIKRAKQLTAQLLTFATGGSPLMQVTSLVPFIREAAQITLSRLGMPCTFCIAADLWPGSIDKEQIGLVFDKIIVNAHEAMPDGGTIGISAVNFTLEEDAHPILGKGDYIKIAISDSGTGIQRENLSKIFDPFYTTKPKGQGLGLAICYSIINRHDGVIDVVSEPGRGSTFSIYLPAANVNTSIAG